MHPPIERLFQVSIISNTSGTSFFKVGCNADGGVQARYRTHFHRIRHYGLLAGASRKATIARIRDLLREAPPDQDPQETAEIVPLTLREPCPCCGGPMRIVEIFRRGQKPMSRAPPQERAA